MTTAASPVQHLTEATFIETIAEGVTVIDFWAGWCIPCRMMAPEFERAAALRPGIRFAKVDVDAEPRIAAAYGISSIPTIMVVRDGRPLASEAGVVRAEPLVEALDRLVETVETAGVAR